MYIEKRWLVPAGLSLLMVGAFFAGALLFLGSRMTQLPVQMPTAQTSVEAQPKAPNPAPQAALVADPVASVLPDAGVAPSPEVIPTPHAAPRAEALTAAPVTGLASQPVDAADAMPAGPAPEEVVDIATPGSGASQINTRGFGDIGLQLQDVNINGPVTFVHISNQGNNNSTNVNTGAGDRIVSDRSHLQSNRSDGSAPEPVSAASAPAGVADTQPTTASGTADHYEAVTLPSTGLTLPLLSASP